MKIQTQVIFLTIAGFQIKIIFGKTDWLFAKNKLRDEIVYYYKDFISNMKPRKLDFTIELIEKKGVELLHKQYESKYFVNLFEEFGKNKIVGYYSINLVQLQLIIRNIIFKLSLKYKVFFLHSSAADINGEACLFLGNQGAGKSTIVNLLKEKFPLLADDISIIRNELNEYYFYQTPFIEREWIRKKSIKYKIAKIFFLKKAHNFMLQKIKNKDYILKKIIEQLFVNKESENIQIKYLTAFVSEFNHFYSLSFAKEKAGLIKLFSL